MTDVIIQQHREKADAAQRLATAQRAVTRFLNDLVRFSEAEAVSLDELDDVKRKFDRAAAAFAEAVRAYAAIDPDSEYYHSKRENLARARAEAEQRYGHIYEGLIPLPQVSSVPAMPSNGQFVYFNLSNVPQSEFGVGTHDLTLSWMGF